MNELIVALGVGLAVSIGFMGVLWLVELGVAAYKIPRELSVVAALPRNPVGKVLKVELRASFEGEGVAAGA